MVFPIWRENENRVFPLLLAAARQLSTLQTQIFPSSLSATSRESDSGHSLNVGDCPGYTLGSLHESQNGLTARLSMAGPACNAFGTDIHNLTIQVTYESKTRLHVNIFDTDDKQYTIPQTVIARPAPPKEAFSQNSDLVFNYNPSPFAFWITRRSEPQAMPLFDTRISSLPKAPIGPVIANDNSTALDGFPLIFEDQYLQLTSALPLNANVYGLGEVVASSGFRRNVGPDGGTIQTMWARDKADPVDENIYGTHPVYLEHRFDESKKTSHSHGVFLMSAAGADILLLTPPNSNVSLIEYRLLGGVLDFYFFSGPTPANVVEQYGELIGLPTWQPVWGFGFQLCKEANIPLEVMWNDIDLYHVWRDFTLDPVNFPGDDLRAFIQNWYAASYDIPIVDAAIPKQVNATDIYDPYTRGVEQRVFLTNPDGSEYIGEVRPGYTVFADWFQNNTQQWWTDALRNWSQSGVEFSGIWLDMNEASSYCDGSCGTGANLTIDSSTFPLPGEPGDLVTECYNATRFGPSGNITVNGTLTCQTDNSALTKRGLGAGKESGVDLNVPPYAIHNGNGRLSIHTLATNATHVDGQAELDVHNLWGMMEGRATHLAINDILPGTRPFIISRSTFPLLGSGLWSYLRFNIAGALQFQLFQIPFVGADTCGFELCNRWMQLSAFMPFYRNHNIRGAISQEPYRWESVANTSRNVIATRYSLLPYWYTLFANASTFGTPPMRALFFEFPDEPELFAIDSQFMVGRDLLVTPVLSPNVTSVKGIFPGRGSVIWRDWYSHEVLKAATGANTTLTAPLGHINVHIRDGSALLLHATPAYTVEETRGGPFSLLVSQAANGQAFGTAYLDDGVSNPPGPSRSLTFSVTKNQLHIAGVGSFKVDQMVEEVTILGVATAPKRVLMDSRAVDGWRYTASKEELVISSLSIDLNREATVQWS
ncbi:glycosyl hydrolases family 31-domain-containing protein [Infundibulicybe gibba]|nr:glycosyl hydrolases family 31-domain-containing protein [Infundibulicybe gibba]